MRIWPLVLFILAGAPATAADLSTGAALAPRWTNGPLADPAFFPIAVWLQSPANAERYRKAGINTYVALWQGPTEEQIATLKAAGMRLICHQNQVGLRHLSDPAVIGWMHGDEPDNAQELPGGKGYGPPIAPAKIIGDYERIRRADPSRPVLLNLGQGVAWDGWYGRGVRSRHPEDYTEYLKGCDIASFDIYPANHGSPEVAGKLDFVARGVERLVGWAHGEKGVWNCIECTQIGGEGRKPTPQEVRAEVWMSLIHGSRGLIYFVHQFKPRFREAALFDDPEMLAAVTQLNREISSLAPVLNSRTVREAATVRSSEETVPVALMTKLHEGSAYLFAVAMWGQATTATFSPVGSVDGQRVEVLGEERLLTIKDGAFSDRFEPWGVHLYRLSAVKAP
jgi:hypothetical protein